MLLELIFNVLLRNVPDACTDGQTDTWTHGHMDGHTDRQTHGQTDAQTDGCTDRRMHEQTDTQTHDIKTPLAPVGAKNGLENGTTLP